MKKSLLILFGESFRLGGQGNRNRGSQESYAEQIEAAKTHLKFISNLKNKNVEMLVSINSYTTQYDNQLTEMYKNVLYDNIFYTDLIGQENLIINCIKRIELEGFDFILCMRIDLFLKDQFMEIFDHNKDMILFPSVCFKPHHKVGTHPRVNDMMVFIPNKYFDLIKENRWELYHHLWFDFIEKFNLKYDDLDTMLNTYHDSDSAKDFNPIYRIVNRIECLTHHTQDIFNKYLF